VLKPAIELAEFGMPLSDDLAGCSPVTGTG
jgi:hypothetical protein